MSKKIDLTHKQFNRFFVISEVGKRKSGEFLWSCQCDCGNMRIISSSNLKSDNSKSCGCLRRELLTTHGLSHDPIYRIWAAIKSRCYELKHSEYKRYGARGIKVCASWINDAEAFIVWAKINGWRKDLQIDRKNNDLGYSPQNCRFISNRKNSLNTRPIRSTNTSGFRGVYKEKRKGTQKYSAKITIFGKQCHIGLFGNSIEAAQAYNKEAKKLGYPVNLGL